MTVTEEMTEPTVLEEVAAEETAEVAEPVESLAQMVTRFAFKQVDQAKWQYSNKTSQAGNELQNAWEWFYKNTQYSLDLIPHTPADDLIAVEIELEKAVIALEQAMSNYTNTLHEAKYELNLKLAALAEDSAPSESIINTQEIEAVPAEEPQAIETQ